MYVSGLAALADCAPALVVCATKSPRPNRSTAQVEPLLSRFTGAACRAERDRLRARQAAPAARGVYIPGLSLPNASIWGDEGFSPGTAWSKLVYLTRLPPNSGSPGRPFPQGTRAFQSQLIKVGLATGAQGAKKIAAAFLLRLRLGRGAQPKCRGALLSWPGSNQVQTAPARARSWVFHTGFPVA